MRHLIIAFLVIAGQVAAADSPKPQAPATNETSVFYKSYYLVAWFDGADNRKYEHKKFVFLARPPINTPGATHRDGYYASIELSAAKTLAHVLRKGRAEGVTEFTTTIDAALFFDGIDFSGKLIVESHDDGEYLEIHNPASAPKYFFLMGDEIDAFIEALATGEPPPEVEGMRITKKVPGQK